MKPENNNSAAAQSVPLAAKALNIVDVAAKAAIIPSSLYDSLKLNVQGLSRQAYQYAVMGMQYLEEAGKISNNKIISIIDFSLPSYEKRLFVINLEQHKLLFHTYVAHGVNSGKAYAVDFSNNPESNKSSLGFYETMETYNGKNGYSLHLQGLEKGFNDKADSRAIVMHGADYVSEANIASQGFLGRSWGCPAVSEQLHKPIINTIKNGSCLFIFSPNKRYLLHSKILKQAAAMAYNNSN
ncbi:MAG: murein L,D-transpeptidase catalytic domain family protein [Bacteroidetes bacterium]|nr:murein L,D-transpeptidase catalytic domain family protein [Bacteroidota bacterium]